MFLANDTSCPCSLEIPSELQSTVLEIDEESRAGNGLDVDFRRRGYARSHHVQMLTRTQPLACKNGLCGSCGCADHISPVDGLLDRTDRLDLGSPLRCTPFTQPFA